MFSVGVYSSRKIEKYSIVIIILLKEEEEGDEEEDSGDIPMLQGIS